MSGPGGVNKGARRKVAPLSCPNCIDSRITVNPSEGDMVCSNCGEVLQQLAIDERSEWRTFANDGGSGADANRVGAVESEYLTQGSVGAVVRREFSLEQSGSSNAALGSRAGSAAGQDKRVLEVHKYIYSISTRLQLHRPVTERAKEIAFLAETRRALPTGRNLKARAVACVYAASKLCECGRTIKEVLSAGDASVKRKDVKNIYKKMQAAELWGAEEMKHSNPEDLVRRFAGALGVEQKLWPRIVAVARNVTEIPESKGKKPATNAAATIAFVLEDEGREVNYAKLVMVSGMADGTIKSALRTLKANKDEILA